MLFVDEIHRFNKAQQDAFLPHVERGTIILVGATTENPSFEVISPLLSRALVVVLKPLNDAALEEDSDSSSVPTRIVGLGEKKVRLSPEAQTAIDRLRQRRCQSASDRVGVHRPAERSHARMERERLMQQRLMPHCSKNRYAMISQAKNTTISSRPTSKAFAIPIRTGRSTGWPGCWRPEKIRNSSPDGWSFSRPKISAMPILWPFSSPYRWRKRCSSWGFRRRRSIWLRAPPTWHHDPKTTHPMSVFLEALQGRTNLW